MSEIPGLQEGVEAINVMFKGSEMFLRLSGGFANWTIEKLAKIVALFYNHMQKKKSAMKEGEVNFRDLVTKNRSGVGIMQIDQNNLKEFIKYAKEMGLSYSIMPDINKQDEYKEIAFPEYQGEAFRYYISQHPDTTRTYTYGEYFDNANPADMAEEIKGLEKEIIEYATTLKNKEAEIEDIPDKAKDKIINEKERSEVDGLMVKIDTSLLFKAKDEKLIMAAVPNTADEYIHIGKEALIDNDGQYYINLKSDAAYMIVNKDGDPVLEEEAQKMITGEEYNTAIQNMRINNEINKAKQAELKGSVKLVRKDADGKIEEKILSGKSEGTKLEELIDKFEAKR